MDDHSSVVILTTDQRSLLFFYRADPSHPWEQIFSCHSPNPDIYYTAIEALPLFKSASSLLVFLAGTDCQLYVDAFDFASRALQPLCVLSVLF